MIDRKSRDRLAEISRHLVSRQYTNFQFDDAAFELKSLDPAISAIYEQLWLLYDDLQEHKLDGKWKLSDSQRKAIARIITFLKSDIEYSWPLRPLWYRLMRPVLELFSFGYATRAIESKFDEGHDSQVWPFSDKYEFDKARENPKYLSSAP